MQIIEENFTITIFFLSTNMLRKDKNELFVLFACLKNAYKTDFFSFLEIIKPFCIKFGKVTFETEKNSTFLK